MILIAVTDMVQQPRRKVFHAVSFIMTAKFQSPENFTVAINYKLEPKLERQQLKYLINQFTVYRHSWHYQQTIFAELPHLDGSPF